MLSKISLRRALPFLAVSSLALSWLASPALAQYDPEPVAFLSWPSDVGAPGEPFHRSVTARLTGDEHRHVVTLQGDVPVMLYEPAVFTSFETLGAANPSNDIDVLRWEANASGIHRDLLATVSSAGLDLVGFDGTNWIDTPIDHSSAFQSALLVRVSDVDHDGRDDILVLSRSQRKIRIKMQQANGTFADAASNPPLFSENILDFDVLQFDTIGSAADLAVDFESGLKVMKLDGTVLQQVVSPRPTLQCMTILRGTTASELDRVVYCTPAAATGPDTQDLYVVRGDQVAKQNTSPLGFGIANLASGDMDGDGQGDLVLSLSNEQVAMIVYGQATSPILNPENPQTWLVRLLPTGTPSTSVARPLIADLNYDGKNDLVLPVNYHDDLTGVLAKVLVLTGPTPRYGYGEYLGTGLSTEVDFLHVICDAIQASIDPNNGSGLVTFPQAQFQHLDEDTWYIETKVYRMAANSLTMPGTPRSQCVTSAASFSSGDGPHSKRIGFETPNTPTDTYLWYLRLVKLDGNNIIQPGTPLLGALAQGSNQNALAPYVYPNWNPPNQYDIVNACDIVTQGVGIRIDGHTRMRHFPPTSGPQASAPCSVHTSYIPPPP
jgi:hypothetical protein